MFFKRRKQDEKEKEKVIISFTRKLGMVCLRSLEGYIEKNKIVKCYVMIPNLPHQNVINYAENISQIETVITSDFKREIEKIKKLYSGSRVEIINLEDFSERNMMRDAI